MKTVLFSFLMLCCCMCRAQSENTAYNKALADSLGADERGMKMYTLVILKTGPNRITDRKIRDSLFAGHMANINRLVKEGKMVVAGPFETNSQHYRGLFILNVKTAEEARILLDADPVLHSKLMEADIFEWYGSAALPKYIPYHDLIEKKKM